MQLSLFYRGGNRDRMIKKLTWCYLAGKWYSQDLSPGKVGCRFYASNLYATFPITCSLVKVCIASPVKALSTLLLTTMYWLEVIWTRPGFTEILGDTWKVCTRILEASSREKLEVRKGSHWNKWGKPALPAWAGNTQSSSVPSFMPSGILRG